MEGRRREASPADEVSLFWGFWGWRLGREDVGRETYLGSASPEEDADDGDLVVEPGEREEDAGEANGVVEDGAGEGMAADSEGEGVGKGGRVVVGVIVAGDVSIVWILVVLGRMRLTHYTSQSR